MNVLKPRTIPWLLLSENKFLCLTYVSHVHGTWPSARFAVTQTYFKAGNIWATNLKKHPAL